MNHLLNASVSDCENIIGFCMNFMFYVKKSWEIL